jgi:predicted nucleic acid-binding Zn ribbon protein
MSGRFKPPGQCPVCGEWVPRGAAACDDCGACEKSGWSGDTHADGLDLPDEDFSYDDFIAREFGVKSSKHQLTSNLWWWVALALLVVFALAAFMPLFG